MLRAKTPADLEQGRQQIEWVDDDDLRELESKSRLGAVLLGFFTWGGGRLYVGDTPRGLGLVAALAGWVALASVLPAALGPLVYTLIGAGGAAWSYQGARAVNKFVATRNDLALRQGPGPAAYRLLAGAAAVDPSLAAALPAVAYPAPNDGPHAPLVDKLRKLSALRRAGVIDETELRDRKIDVLSGAAEHSIDHDDLLYALLPLRDEGALTEDDFAFIKQLGGSR